MRNLKKFLAFTIVLIMVPGIPTFSLASNGSNGTVEGGLGNMPAGTYTYVSEKPVAEADSNEGQAQFIYRKENNLVWAFGSEGKVTTGVETLTGDELEFFKGLYFSDRPVTDWVGGGPKDTEGYAGDVAGNVQITITENGKISKIRVASPTTRTMAIVTKEITDSTLTIAGSTRGRPNLLQSCITLFGSTNALYLTAQGDVILDGITIGDGKGVGLKADKIGGDTFIVGTVTVDGTVEWNNKMGVILPLGDRPGTLLTNGYDITMTGGSNIGRVGRTLNISTGEGAGGNIIIGATVSTDSTRGGKTPTADTSKDGVTINTIGSITAGLGNVIIGTNTEKAVIIDLIGSIQGADVTIKPSNYGKPGNVTGAIGNITATGSIDIKIGTVNSGSVEETVNVLNAFTVWQSSGDSQANVIGNLTARSGNITFVSGEINGNVGNIAAPNGTVNLTIEKANNFMPKTSSIAVNGKPFSLDGYSINGHNYFKLNDLANILSGTKIKLDGAEDKCTAFNIGGNKYFKLRDIGEAFDFDVDWDGAAKKIVIDTGKSYTP